MNYIRIDNQDIPFYANLNIDCQNLGCSSCGHGDLYDLVGHKDFTKPFEIVIDEKQQ